jgi:hypothetical protein
MTNEVHLLIIEIVARTLLLKKRGLPNHEILERMIAFARIYTKNSLAVAERIDNS